MRKGWGALEVGGGSSQSKPDQVQGTGAKTDVTGALRICSVCSHLFKPHTSLTIEKKGLNN